MHVDSSSRFVSRMIRRSFWAIDEQVLGRIQEVRVRVSKEPNGGEERKKEKEERKNEENRFRSLLCKVVNRVGSHPTHSPVRVAVGDPDPSVLGFGPFTRRLLVLFSVSWIVLAMCTPMFAIWTSCVSWLLYKISKKLLCVLGIFVTVFVIFYMWKLMKIWQVLISHLIGISCVFFTNFLACLLVQILVPWFWWLALDSMVIYPCSHSSSLNRVKFDAFVTFSMLLNLDFFWYFAILLNLILDTNCVIFYNFVTFDSWLLFCDISIFLLNLILDYYFVMFPLSC